MNRTWLHKELARPPADKIYLGLGEIDISHIGNRRDSSHAWFTWQAREVNAETCRAFLESCLDLPAFDELEPANGRSRLLRLDLAITGMSPGITALRLFEWLTLFGLGHAHLQIEGILSEPRRRQVLIKFAARRRHAGLSSRKDWFPILGDQTLPGDFPDTMVGHLIRRIAYDIVMELDARLNTGRK